ncbi:MAG: hypothetical protein FWF45_01805 [Coriobacteriia bacterium]|nr:hypothetical protein [Coriobacteriia bacterium]
MRRKDSSDVHAPVVVLKTSRDDDLALAKSMLMSADIPFYTKNEWIADLFGYARFGGHSRITGPIELLVAPRDADDAYEILKPLDRPGQTTAVSRDNEEERTQASEHVVVFSTRCKSELAPVESQLKTAGISYLVTAKVVDHETQVQVTVARCDRERTRKVLSLPEDSLENSKDMSVSSSPPVDSPDQSSVNDHGSGLWGSAPRTVRSIAVIILAIAVMSWVTGPLLSALASSAPEPEYLSWGEHSTISGGEVQGVTISVSGTSCPDSYQAIEDKMMDQTSITVQDVIDMLSELSTSSGVNEIAVTLPGSSEPLTVPEAIARLSKMTPSRSIQIGSLSWASEL